MLKIVVESVRCVSLNGVWEEIQISGLDWSIVCFSGICVVQSCLKCLVCNIKLSNVLYCGGGGEEEKEDDGERLEIESYCNVSGKREE